MQAAIASRTALGVALRRAVHAAVDEAPPVLDDAIGPCLLRQFYAEAFSRYVAKAHRPLQRPMRAFLLARSRFAEDALATAVAAGVRQYVLLGAGLDTFAYRNPHAGLTVFEVDHPATQRWKRGLLDAGGMERPARLVYAPVDFERQSLAEELAGAGFDRSEPAQFSMLGVTPYLTRPAFQAAIAYVLGCGRQAGVGGLVFDYARPRGSLPFTERLVQDALVARVKRAGEPFQLYLDPQDAAAELHGFSRVEDVGGAELNARYFAGRGDRLRMRGSAGRMVASDFRARP